MLYHVFQEAIMMLERYTSDFQKLIEWLKLKWEYEHTPPPQRPTSLTWEIRTSSPGKKPVIIVHQARIDENQECPPTTPNAKDCDLVLEEFLDCSLEYKDDNKENILIDENKKIQTVKKIDKSQLKENENIKSDQSKGDSKTQNKDSNNSAKHEFPRDTNLSTSRGDHEDASRQQDCDVTTTKTIESCEGDSVCDESIDISKPKEQNQAHNTPNTVITKGKDIINSKIRDNGNNKSPEVKEGETKLAENVEAQPSCTEGLQGKSPTQKTGPTVYMNKVGGNKAPCRRMAEGKTAASPPLTRRPTIDSFRNFAAGNGGSRHPLPNALTRSYSSLHSVGRSTVRGQGSTSDAVTGKTHGTGSARGLGNSSRTASTSSLSSTTSSSGQSWADKVRGAPVSLESSQVSLQVTDDGEGWEVVRRGRRSHGGSTASLNSNNPYAPKDVRSGSLKTEGHSCEIKKRFHVPSSAMSMPSLFLGESNALNDASKDKCSVSNDYKKILKSSNHGSGAQCSKKVVSESVYAPAVNSEADGRQQSFYVWKKCERRNRKSEKGAGENTKRMKCKDNNAHLNVVEKSDLEDKKKHSDDTGRTCEESVPASSLVGTKTEDSEDVKTEEGGGESRSLKNFQKTDNVVCNNHMCDPSIPEISETSDAEEDENRETKPSKPQLSFAPGTVEGDMANPEACIYDIECQMDEEELLSNAAALESAFKEELRLKQQIEETEKTEIKVEDEDCEEDGSDASETAGRALSPFTLPFDNLASTMSWADQGMAVTEISMYFCPCMPSLHALISSFFTTGTSTHQSHHPHLLPITSSALLSLQVFHVILMMVDAFESLENVRHPGRVLHIHEKLSSPSRKRSLSEKMRRHEERIAKAQELRENLIFAKTEKLKDLFKKIEEVRQDKEGLLVKKRDLFDRKMERAEEKRRQFLQEIVNKAHDEENKAKEIAFINGLEAKNKLLDIMQQHQARMAELCEKRRQKCERIDRQQAERREELLEQAREKARDREERLCALQQQKQEESARRHEENIELIRQRALESTIMKYSRGCDDAPRLIRYETKKLCTLCNSLITSEVYLLSHLRGRRHQEALRALHQADMVSSEDSETYNLKHIVDAPANIDDPQSGCITQAMDNSGRVAARLTLAATHPWRPPSTNDSGVTHRLSDPVTSMEGEGADRSLPIAGREIREEDPCGLFSLTRDKERHKALKRRCRKIRTRMVNRGKEYNTAFKRVNLRESPNKIRINKSLQQIAKLVANQGSGPWPTADLTALDRPLLELIRILEKKEKADQAMIGALDGFTKIDSVLKSMLDISEERPCVIPAKSLGYSGRVLLGSCRDNVENCRYVLFSNLAGTMIDYLIQRMNSLVSESTTMGSNNSINSLVNLPSDAAAGAVFEVLAEVIQVLCQEDLHKATSTQDPAVKDRAEATWHRLQDVVSYCVSVGLVDKVSWYFSHVQGPLDNEAGVVEVILSAMKLISALAKALSMRTMSEDPTQLIGTLHVTDACGVVSLLYGLLLHQGGRSAMPQAPPKLSQTAQALTTAATTLLHNLASLDLTMFQAVLGSEGISLELRHIASFLLWYCSSWPSEDILHNIIHLVGFFAVNNKDNQETSSPA
ncbi:S phase cyclin A-associated protein in the endoplasmic reticulum [Chionoecetes opilio]|uniref:S phase cyclin A-associated protein in the endoplasmic reticulum n=1 Tax=Chionoecetes opilio TaxID=41210 RepID=A0A8J8WMK6_CHIOP|nr:S phase cyclin A-associated protein in the endoplasmic reticulum [Chionoecetes opilio]